MSRRGSGKIKSLTGKSVSRFWYDRRTQNGICLIFGDRLNRGIRISMYWHVAERKWGDPLRLNGRYFPRPLPFDLSAEELLPVVPPRIAAELMARSMNYEPPNDGIVYMGSWGVGGGGGGSLLKNAGQWVSI